MSLDIMSLAANDVIFFADLAKALTALDAAERASPRLSHDQVARFENLRAARGDDEAGLWRAAHIALRIVLERYAGIGAAGQAYAIEPGGRPRLVLSALGGVAPHFSLSHAGGYALIAVSHAGPIGVDLEVTRTITVSPERRQRIETAATLLAPAQPLPVENDPRFLQAWVRLEAVAKASGLGIGRILTEAGVVGGNATDASGRRAASDTTEGAAIDVRDLTLKGGCFGAVAGARLPQLVVVREFPENAGGIARIDGVCAAH